MTAVSFVFLESDNDDDEVKVVEHEVTGSSYSPIGSVIGFNRNEAIEHPSGAVSDSCDIMVLCNDARLIGNDDTSENVDREATPNAQYTIEGEPTEAALLCLVENRMQYHHQSLHHRITTSLQIDGINIPLLNLIGNGRV